MLKWETPASFFIVCNYSSENKQSQLYIELLHFVKFTVIYQNDICILNLWTVEQLN